MNLQEVAKLLTFMALLDKRTLGEADVEAWAMVLPDGMLLADALEGVKAHHRETREYITPHDVIKRSITAASKRVRSAGEPDYPPELTWDQERQWHRLWIELVHSGQTPEDAKAIADHQLGIPKRAELVAKPEVVRQALARIGSGPRHRPAYDPVTEETRSEYTYAPDVTP